MGESSFPSEEVSELQPGLYYPRYIMEDPYEYGEGYPITDSSRIVTRWFGGVFVMFNKRSKYNRIHATYDARHARMNSSEFRKYIQSFVDIAKEKKLESI
ncbi:MAG: hypothetical protein OCD01_19550 [Fibrobacterales bacterium]